MNKTTIQSKNNGVYHTNDKYSKLMLEYLDKYLPTDWMQTHTIWDPCWGEGDLTKSREFKNIYVSDIDENILMNQNNPEATKFIFDFLNDFEITKLPPKLLTSIINKEPMVIIMNPPFINSGPITKTKIRDMMVSEKLVPAQSQLFIQFMYRYDLICRINPNCVLVIIAPPIFLSGGSYKAFRKFWLNRYKYFEGFIFSAKNYMGCSGDWGVSCSYWIPGSTENKNEFEFEIE